MNGERDSLRPDDDHLAEGTHLSDRAARLSYPGRAGIFDAGRNAEDPVGLQDPGPIGPGSIGEEPTPDAPKAEATPEERNPVRARRALRRLQNGPPSDFEQMIDLLYEWREHLPGAQVTDVMRKLVGENHNMSDKNAIAAMKNFIKEVRMDKVTAAIARMGLDKAESVLGLKKDPEDP